MEPNTLTLEADFARQLGLDRETVRTTRQAKLEEGEHYERTAAGIGLTPTGVNRLLEALAAKKEAGGAGNESARPDSTTALPGAATAAPSVLEVVRLVPNQTMVLARPEGAAKNTAPVVLRVPFNTDAKGVRAHLFKVGMRVQAKHLTGATWAYHGPRPRFAGDPRCLVAKTRPVPASPAPQA